MQIARDLAGYTPRRGRLLRRAMGKKIGKEMAAQRGDFVTGAVERGIGQGDAEAIFEACAKFAGYGFNKIARRALCPGRLSDRLSEGELSGRIPGRVDDAGYGQHRQARRIPRRGRTACRSRSSRRRSTAPASSSMSTAIPSITRSPRCAASAGRRSRASFRRAATSRSPISRTFARRINPRAVNKRVLESLAASGAFDALEPNRARAYAARRYRAGRGAARARE